jgi:hypothetical protein
MKGLGRLWKMKKDTSYSEESKNSFQFLKRQKIYRETGDLYLDRLIIIRCFLGSIMFHKIYLTDSDCMHDHSWSFRTIILKGGYFEQIPRFKKGCSFWHNEHIEKWYKPGTILYRPAGWVHRLRITKPAWTLVFTGPTKREWGFWTPKGWLKSNKYKNVGNCQ